jgi:NO-binding membrane sensor protein with MHYT domain
MGIGIWAMHFKGMLAFRLPVPVEYHWPTVLASLLVAVLASAVALYVASRPKMGPLKMSSFGPSPSPASRKAFVRGPRGLPY